VDDAREMLRLAEAASKENAGVAVVNNKFIGPPMVLAAKKTLSRHEAIVKRTQAREQ
jgi:citrate lyase subunit beta / citryl-CoA lyase